MQHRLHRLETRVLQLVELHEQLQEHHNKLRSKFYGTLGQQQQQRESAQQLTHSTNPADILAARARARST